MTFIRVANLATDDAINFMIYDYAAIDRERQLCLITTGGRTRNARRWFVYRYELPSGRRVLDLGKVGFRAWTLVEAMQRLEEPAIKKRIDELAQKARLFCLARPEDYIGAGRPVDIDKAVEFGFALVENEIEFQITFDIREGKRFSLLRCTNGKEADFLKICQKYYPEFISYE